jgi:hypothetical protein
MNVAYRPRKQVHVCMLYTDSRQFATSQPPRAGSRPSRYPRGGPAGGLFGTQVFCNASPMQAIIVCLSAKLTFKEGVMLKKLPSNYKYVCRKLNFCTTDGTS